MSALSDRLDAVRRGISDAAVAAHRSPDDVTTIVVTKFHPASLVRELHDLGVRDFGESRHQEARSKTAELADLTDATWHFIGQLQSKKARQATEYSSVVHSVDRSSLVDALVRAERDIECFIQINLANDSSDDDSSRGGAAPGGVADIAERILSADRLSLRGVMGVAPLGEEPRRAFARLREASESLRMIAPTASEISAGMSGDYREAILEGATHLRIGSAITGNRPPAG